MLRPRVKAFYHEAMRGGVALAGAVSGRECHPGWQQRNRRSVGTVTTYAVYSAERGGRRYQDDNVICPRYHDRRRGELWQHVCIAINPPAGSIE